MVVGNVDIGGAAVAFAGAEEVVIDRTLQRQGSFFLLRSTGNRATEFLPGASFFAADSGKFHFEVGRT